MTAVVVVVPRGVLLENIVVSRLMGLPQGKDVTVLGVGLWAGSVVGPTGRGTARHDVVPLRVTLLRVPVHPLVVTIPILVAIPVPVVVPRVPPLLLVLLVLVALLLVLLHLLLLLVVVTLGLVRVLTMQQMLSRVLSVGMGILRGRHLVQCGRWDADGRDVKVLLAEAGRGAEGVVAGRARGHGGLPLLAVELGLDGELLGLVLGVGVTLRWVGVVVRVVSGGRVTLAGDHDALWRASGE